MMLNIENIIIILTLSGFLNIKDINKLKKTIKDSLNSFEERHTNLLKTSRSQSIFDNTINKIKSNENT